jgi:hypothetical protein
LYADGKQVGEGKVAEDAVSVDHRISSEEAVRIAMAQQ